MDVSLELLYVVVGAVLGFAAARLSTVLDDRKAKREKEAARRADWRFDKTNTLQVWLLTNVGDAPALDVRLEHGEVMSFNEGEQLDLAPGESVTVRGNGMLRDRLAPWEDVPSTRIKWTSHRGEAAGPVTRAMPV